MHYATLELLLDTLLNRLKSQLLDTIAIT
jgi:hypothetical protein